MEVRSGSGVQIDRQSGNININIKPGSRSHGTRRRISYGQNLTDDRGKSGWSWLIRIQYDLRTFLTKENNGEPRTVC